MKRMAIVLAVAVVGLAVAAAYGVGNWGSDRPSGDNRPLKTVEVGRMTLLDYEDATGAIGFGEMTPLRYQAAEREDALGLVTWLPSIGARVSRGQPVLRVDDQPVVLLYGALPLYRTLSTGTAGGDVTQLEENLRELGYSGFTVDDRFSEATARAVKRWQQAMGLPDTGTVMPGQVLYATSAVRVAEHRLRVGDVASGDVLGYTGTTTFVTATVSLIRLRREVKAGTKVTVVLPDGLELAGSVRQVMTPSAADEPGGGEPKLDVQVEVADQSALKDRQGRATVRFVVDSRTDVLAVPVVALVALAEGGYGVQVAEEASQRYVAVGTGLFARGFVEITSGDVHEGTRVVIPA